MSAQKVLVFGPTGAVGGAAALEAHKLGAQVHLAMRDPKKATPNLPQGLERHQADLTDPASVEQAVKESGATAVFIYITFHQDLKPTAEALKKAGVQHVVLLSSYSIYPDRQAALTKNFISKAHAEAEQALEEVGLTSTYLRPMYFASNIWQSKPNIQAGEIPIYKPDAVDDYIAPEDIGAIAGAKLFSGQPEIIPICGPKLIPRQEAWKIVGEELGKDLKLPSVGREEYISGLEKNGVPAFVTDLLAKQLEEDTKKRYPEDLYGPASSNVKKYTGRDPIQFRDWVKKHKDEGN